MKNTLKVRTPSDCEVVLIREFDAPRRLVYDTMTRPELLARWLLGPPGWTMPVCDNDVRVGGAFRHVWHGEGGAAMEMRGVYREVVPNERLVRTEAFAFGCDVQAGEQIATLVLTEQGGKTTLTLTVLYPSQEARDGALGSGMEQGVAMGYDRLDGILAELPASSN